MRRSTSKKRVNQQARATTKASLRITCKDGRGVPISVASRVRVTPETGVGASWTARGRTGAVSEFQFNVPPGRYVIEAEADGFKRCRDATSVVGGEPTLKDVLLRIADDENKDYELDQEEGEKHLVDGRFTYFLSLRSPDSLKKRGAKEFPAEARTRALQHARRMTTASAASVDVNVKRIDDPVPRSSFGSVDAFVEVKGLRKARSFVPTTLTIPFDPERARGIDKVTLRIFHIDPKTRRFTMMKDSIPDLHVGAVQAVIDRAGIYGLYGLPLSPGIRRTVDLFNTLRDQLIGESRAGIKSLQNRICQLILCDGGFSDQGFGTSICDMCVGMDIGPDGLPEGQIIPGGPVITPGCNWTCIGPRNINGRVRSMAVHPSDGNIVVAGTGTGGVWLSRDAGQSWTPVMHDEGSLSIGAVAVQLTDPANPAGNLTIYAGTGEPTWWPGYAGVGVLKSIDSGATWTATGALPAPGNTGFSAILIDPTSVSANPATTILYAAGNPGGLYRSADGGATWTRIRAATVQGVALDPAVPGGLYTAEAYTGVFRFDPVATTWTAFNTGFAPGFPLLIQIAIGKTAPNTMYAKLDQTVYKYDTATSQWTSIGNHGATTYTYWNNVLEVDPVDPNIVIAGGIWLERTYDSGATWQTIGGLHSDQHAAVFDSTNHLTVYAGNDGGVYRGTYSSASSLGSWVKISDGLIVTEFNDVGTSLGSYDVIGGGSQDNGTSRTTGGLTWDSILGADGGYFVVDPSNPYVQYAESQNGGLNKTTNGGASFFGAGAGFPGGPWITPILLDPTSPVEPNRVLFAGGSGQVYRTINSAGSWSASSPAMGGEVLALALAPSSSAIVYAGTGVGRIWRSSDNGATVGNWVEITTGTVVGSAPLPQRAIIDIGVHPTDANTLYVAFSGFNASTPTRPGHVYRGVSTDGGATWMWTDVTSNLPDIPANAIEILPSSPNTLYVGTDAGVFRTTNGGNAWGMFSDGLPSVIVSDLALDDTGTLLRAATYGRGMWQIRLTSCVSQDVYVRDSKLDTGESIPSPSGVADPTIVGANVYWWESPDIKVDAYPYLPVDALFDGVEFDVAANDDVVRNDASHPNANRLYVQVHNRGPLAAHNVKVKVLWADASAGLPVLPTDFWSTFPNNWSAVSNWNIVDVVVPFQQIPTLLPNTPKVLRWDWNVPASAAAHTCMLAVVTSDEDPVVRSDANLADRQLGSLVPNDKHVALRNLHVITGSAPFGGIPPTEFVSLLIHNPFRDPQFFDLVVDREALGRGTQLAVLLPQVLARSDLRKLDPPGVRVENVKQKGWWASALKGVGRASFVYAAQIGHPGDDPCHRAPTIPGLLVRPEKPLRIGIAMRAARGAKPGDTEHFSIVQRMGNVIVGGSSYELRIPPVTVSAQRAVR